MSSLEWQHIAHVSEYIGFGLSLWINSTLIFLIVRKSRKELGNYRYLMMCFSFFAIFYSAIDVFVQPTIHIHGTTFMVFQSLETFGVPKTVGAALCALYCSCYGMTIVLLAVHFVYRYFAVCRTHLLFLFEGWFFMIWPCIVIGFGTDWGLTSYFLEPETPASNEYVKETILEHYALRMDQIAYVGPHYFMYDKDGKKSYNVVSCLGILNLMKIIGISFGTVFFCGISTYRKMQSQSSTATKKTRDLQKQLFKALVVQTVIPVIFMYIPVSILFISPFFELEIGAATSFVAVTLALYPALDPLAVIYFVRDYRNAVAQWLCTPRKYTQNIGPTPVSESTGGLTRQQTADNHI
ncbi:unnamed protein product [Caenorhabditis auriculariae]|uniref:Serpentine receptor class r-10 n=1 Tax=Caenorhabditis auriculariae TaxID=2777116 RepID=A0A8S1H412_9PELO|nr:unnamed protein product [Caenorhabditis auriculariae]